MLQLGTTRWVLTGLAALTFSCAALAAAAPEHASATTDCSLTPPANITKPNDANLAGAVVAYPAPTTSGTCATVTCSPASGGTYSLGTTQVTCTASTTPPVKASFLIRVNDTQPPTLSVPANLTVGNDPGQASAAVTFAPATASDNAPGVTASCDHLPGSLFAVGTTSVTCTARDTSENIATKSFDVTVNDIEAPETLIRSGPSSSTKNLKAKFKLTATDPAATFECKLDKGAFKPCESPQDYRVGKGKHRFLARATDASGNTDPTPAKLSWKVK